MRALRLGMNGDDVKAWQLFLRGEDIYEGVVDGDFGQGTLDATKAWQKAQGLVSDGVAGLKTQGKAQGQGFNPGFEDNDTSELGPAWPPTPAFPPLDAAGRMQVFGAFQFDPAPTPGNPEGIRIKGAWVEE